MNTFLFLFFFLILYRQMNIRVVFFSFNFFCYKYNILINSRTIENCERRTRANVSPWITLRTVYVLCTYVHTYRDKCIRFPECWVSESDWDTERKRENVRNHCLYLHTEGAYIKKNFPIKKTMVNVRRKKENKNQ